MSDQNWNNIKQSTKAVWAGETGIFFEGAAQVPVVNSVSYSHDDVDEWFEVATGKRKGHIYSRNTNPTVVVFEEKMRVLESAEAATSFSTGMARDQQYPFHIIITNTTCCIRKGYIWRHQSRLS